MKLFRLTVPILAGLMLAFSTMAAFARSAPAAAGAPASPPLPGASETSLLPSGDAEDIHADASGRLWISEVDSNTVREFDPATRAYTLYTGLTGGARDAQLGPDGKLWWLQGTPQAVARMDISSRVVTTWPVDTHYAVALTFDASHRLWFVDGLLSGLYRFDPSSTQYCDYALPGAGGGPFIVEHDGALWLSDYVSATLGRMTATTNAYTYWPVDFGDGFTLPNDAVFDPHGDLWWADASLAKIGRLEPSANRLTLFGQPGLADPQQVVYAGGKIWFTDLATATVGYIDPATALGTGQHVATPTTTTITPDCAIVGPGFIYTAGLSTGLSGFGPLVYTSTLSADGALFKLPISAEPRGLAATGFNIWVTDINRDKLIRLDTALRLYLPLVRR